MECLLSSSGFSPTPASSRGGVFPISMPVLSISVSQGIQVGVYPLHSRHTFPISFSLSQDSSQWFIPLPSLSCQTYFSFCSLSSFLFTPFWHLFFFMRNHETYSKLIISLTFGFTVFVSFGYSCMGSTGSSWETLPDGRLLVC